ncbi:Uncharacterized protein OBRU01_11307 [Operophtera brumata]|uniref:Uncharacterized protein n=1 Tax=Operophtera brumata TaxID=104452 RepID=A0A0L7LDN8_OPEBR|nr:Uncharacterized protein OBRU01_11307 [Operophtera brumata]
MIRLSDIGQDVGSRVLDLNRSHRWILIVIVPTLCRCLQLDRTAIQIPRHEYVPKMENQGSME